MENTKLLTWNHCLTWFRPACCCHAVLTVIALCLKGMGISAACFADSGTVEIVQRRQKIVFSSFWMPVNHLYFLGCRSVCTLSLSVVFVLLGYNLHELLRVKHPYDQTLWVQVTWVLNLWCELRVWFLVQFLHWFCFLYRKRRRRLHWSAITWTLKVPLVSRRLG